MFVVVECCLSRFGLSSFDGNLRLKVVFVVVVFGVSFVLCVVSIGHNLWFVFVHDLEVSCGGVVVGVVVVVGEVVES